MGEQFSVSGGLCDACPEKFSVLEMQSEEMRSIWNEKYSDKA